MRRMEQPQEAYFRMHVELAHWTQRMISRKVQLQAASLSLVRYW